MAKNGGSRSKKANRDAYIAAIVSGKSEIAPCGPCPVRELAVCGALALDELHALAAIVHEIDFAPHQSVFHEWDEAECFFIVTSGVASVSKLLADGRRQIMGFLYSADFFGLAIDDHYANCVTAITNLTLCRFLRDQYEALLDRFPELEKRLLGQASNELAVAQEQMVLLGRKTAIEKVASFLLMNSERVRRNGHIDNPLWLPMIREDIGDYLGLTTETTSRTFTRLQRLGAISKLPDARIDLTNCQMLQEIAEGE